MSEINKLGIDLLCLPELTIAELETVWRNYLGSSPPIGLPKSLLARLLAYRLQVQCCGSLSRRAIRYLDGIAVDLEAGKEPGLPYPDNSRLKSGSVLVREHDGVQQRVMVLDEGYAWNGRAFGSLSAVAKAITGTNWNGQRFFGLREKGQSVGEALA